MAVDYGCFGLVWNQECPVLLLNHHRPSTVVFPNIRSYQDIRMVLIYVISYLKTLPFTRLFIALLIAHQMLLAELNQIKEREYEGSHSTHKT